MRLPAAVALAACLHWSACAESSVDSAPQSFVDAADAGVPLGVRVRFDLGPGSAMNFGAIPWPDDLYLDKTPRVVLAQFPEPHADADYARLLREALGELDGFGVSSPIYFFIEGGDIDESSLPQTAEESTGARSSVFLIDVDTGSPEAFQRVRAEARWSAMDHRLALRPALGHPLIPGRRYAALVTRRVRDGSGRALTPSASFAAIRSPEITLSDARLLQARAAYTPVLETLAKSGTPREDVVAMAVFRVQTANPDLEAARRIVRLNQAPVASVVATRSGAELDARFKGFSLVHGTFPSPSFVSAMAKTHGAWQRDEAGQLRVKRTDSVPFTLFVPSAGSQIPVVIYQHQRGRERSDAIELANRLAADHIAVLAIDAPFQGLRAHAGDAQANVDVRNRFTGAALPDYFGDDRGDFYGTSDALGGLAPAHPFYVRDALRQGVVDLMSAVRLLEQGDLSFAGRKLSTTRLGFVGEDIGAQMGVMVAPFEPNLQAMVLFAAGGSVVEEWWHSAADESLFSDLAVRLGRDVEHADYQADPPAFWPGLGIYDTLLGRGDPLAYASALRRAPVNLLLLMSKDDEVVSNLVSEALAVALGATFVSGQARYVGDLGSDGGGNASVSGNFAIGEDRVTRVLQAYDPADHNLLISGSGTRRYEHPLEPPFSGLETPQSLINPTQAALDQIADYFQSFFACVSSTDASSTRKCAAQVNVNPL